MAIANYLITADEVRECTTAPNVDLKDTKIQPNIHDAIFLEILPFLGEDYYAELLAEKVANSFSAANQIVWDRYIKQASAYAVLHKAVPETDIQIGDGGIGRYMDDELGIKPDSKEDPAAKLEANYREKFSQYLTQADEYMTHPDRISLYPNYRENIAEPDPIEYEADGLSGYIRDHDRPRTH